MTEEDKLKLLEELYNKVRWMSSSEARETCLTLEKIFPELKESKDEKIRKDCIKYLDWEYQHCSINEDKIKIEKCIAWLEKQGDQKTTDKLEPKFKVDDWIVYEGLGTYKVVEIHEGWYNVIDNNDRRWSVMFERESLCHIWTIQDAKDGDILVSGSNRDIILMFRGIGNTKWDDVIDYHCYYDCYREDFIVQEGLIYWGDVWDCQLKPATKEQRDLLFKKMKEAGYEWDVEKKELKEDLCKAMEE